MNIEINIETLLFGNDTYTDHTNSKFFEKVLFFLLSRQNDFVLQVSSYNRVLLYIYIYFFLVIILHFFPVCINS